MTVQTHQILAAARKEFHLVLRDREALATLFLLPAMFVLIMSLALQDAFNERAGVRFSMLVVNQDDGRTGKALLKFFDDHASFEVTTGDNPDAIGDAVRTGQYQFALHIPPQASALGRLRAQQQLGLVTKTARPQPRIAIRFFADPTLRADYRLLMVNAINNALQGAEARILMKAYSALATTLGAPPGSVPRKVTRLFQEVTDPYNVNKEHRDHVPTSVQQNAPGWGLLAMFFLVVPLAGTLVHERMEGNLTRLQTMSAPISLLLLGKMAPYFIINQIQFGLILLEGIYLLPLFGGEALTLGAHPWAIVPLTFAISFAAIGYGLLVAAFCRTPEQATVFGATSVLILGALGGIMVPKVIMPPTMQALTNISPMSWGLDGFLEVFVRDENVMAILDNTAALVVFGIVCLGTGILHFHRKLAHA
ncbi:MAG: ABC transporter permease [Gammaproteobacteria bacterium]|nr:MAG: ABC transporter permease [Gammaproteobacteria bacterium]